MLSLQCEKGKGKDARGRTRTGSASSRAGYLKIVPRTNCGHPLPCVAACSVNLGACVTGAWKEKEKGIYSHEAPDEWRTRNRRMFFKKSPYFEQTCPFDIPNFHFSTFTSTDNKRIRDLKKQRKVLEPVCWRCFPECYFMDESKYKKNPLWLWLKQKVPF